jgi:hypothetical protein
MTAKRRGVEVGVMVGLGVGDGVGVIVGVGELSMVSVISVGAARVGGSGKVVVGRMSVGVGDWRSAIGAGGVTVGKTAGGEQAGRKSKRASKRTRRERPVEMSDFVRFFRHFPAIFSFM